MAPTATPMVAHSALAAMSPPLAARSAGSRVGSTPLPCNSGMATASMTTWATAASAAPAAATRMVLAATTRTLEGVTSRVGTISPWRNSSVNPRIPSTTANSDRLMEASRKKVCSGRGLCSSAGWPLMMVEKAPRAATPAPPAVSPMAVRVVASLTSSALSNARMVVLLSGQLEEHVLEAGGLADQLIQHHPGLRGQGPDPLGAHAEHSKGSGFQSSDLTAGGQQHTGQPIGVGCAHPRRGPVAGGQGRHGGLGDQPATLDDHDLVGQLGHLGQQVAGHQHRATGAG